MFTHRKLASVVGLALMAAADGDGRRGGGGGVGDMDVDMLFTLNNEEGLNTQVSQLVNAALDLTEARDANASVAEQANGTLWSGFKDLAVTCINLEQNERARVDAGERDDFAPGAAIDTLEFLISRKLGSGRLAKLPQEKRDAVANSIKAYRSTALNLARMYVVEEVADALTVLTDKNSTVAKARETIRANRTSEEEKTFRKQLSDFNANAKYLFKNPETRKEAQALMGMLDGLNQQVTEAKEAKTKGSKTWQAAVSIADLQVPTLRSSIAPEVTARPH